MMMKNNILSVVISVLLAGTANTTEIYNKDNKKLDLYGKVDILHFFGKKCDSDESSASLNIRGDTQIFKKVTVFFHSEWKKTNKSETENKKINYLSYVGLKIADFGSLDYGRNYGVLYDINRWTDVLPLYGADSISQNDSYMTGRNRNLLTYRNTDFFGIVDDLNFVLQYKGKNTKSNRSDNSDNLKNNGDELGVAVNYNIGLGITLGGGYSKSNRGLNKIQKNKRGSGDNISEVWNVGIKYDANNLYLAAMYGETRNITRFGKIINNNNMKQSSNKTENLELVAQYFFNEIGLKPSIAYIASIEKDLIDSFFSQKQDLTKYISLGAFYYFNKNLNAFIDYKINLINSNNFTKKYGIDKDNLIGLGLVYQF